MKTSGPLNSFTSSRKMWRFSANGSGTPVLAVVGGEVVVPLPHVPGERLLGIHLDLLHVELVAENLHGRPDEPGVADHARVDLASQVQAHGGAHRVALLLAEVLRPALGEKPRQLRPEHLDLRRRANSDGRTRNPSSSNCANWTSVSRMSPRSRPLLRCTYAGRRTCDRPSSGARRDRLHFLPLGKAAVRLLGVDELTVQGESRTRRPSPSHSSMSAPSTCENLSLTRSASGSYPQAPQYSILNFIGSSPVHAADAGARGYIRAAPPATSPRARVPSQAALRPVIASRSPSRRPSSLAIALAQAHRHRRGSGSSLRETLRDRLSSLRATLRDRPSSLRATRRVQPSSLRETHRVRPSSLLATHRVRPSSLREFRRERPSSPAEFVAKMSVGGSRSRVRTTTPVPITVHASGVITMVIAVQNVRSRLQQSRLDSSGPRVLASRHASGDASVGQNADGHLAAAR